MSLLLGLAGCAAPPPVAVEGSFGDFVPPRAAHYLACPQDYCLSTPDEVTRPVPIGAGPMRALVRQTLARDASVRLTTESNEGLRQVYRVGDGAAVITVEIVDIDEQECGLAIYSQSNGGESDRARVRRWLDWLRSAASGARQ